MKKITSLVLIVSMLVLSAVPSFAQNDKSVNSLYKMIESYEKSGFDVEILEENSNLTKYKLTSSENYDYEATVDASIDNNGNILLKISEGKLYDELKILSDGEIILNNKPVVVTTIEENKVLTNNAISSTEITPKGAQRIYYSESAPYGSNSDYTAYTGKGQKNIALQQALNTVTVAALASVLIYALGFAGAASQVLGGVATFITAYASRNDIDSKTMSVKYSTYVHKNNGFNVTSRMSTEKYEIDCYAFENFAGYIGSKNVWQVFAY